MIYDIPNLKINKRPAEVICGLHYYVTVYDTEKCRVVNWIVTFSQASSPLEAAWFALEHSNHLPENFICAGITGYTAQELNNLSLAA